jgi:hypothetical protein
MVATVVQGLLVVGIESGYQTASKRIGTRDTLEEEGNHSPVIYLVRKKYSSCDGTTRLLARNRAPGRFW